MNERMNELMDAISHHLSWLEPSDIHRVIKHVFNHCKLLSNSDRMAGKDHLEFKKMQYQAYYTFKQRN